MDNFDKRIKQIAKDENWEIPNEIDNNISKLLKNIEEPKTVRKRPLKVAILVASLSILTITTAFAIENIIEYFNYNKNSEYISSKEELETFGSVVSLTSKDKGIEFKLDNISVDDNYINIFYTIKGEKSIDEYYTQPALLDMSGNCIIIQARAEPLKSALPNVTNDISYISFLSLHKT